MIRIALTLLLLAVFCCFSVAGSGGYDASTAQFHPSGRILQTEYAKRSVLQRGGPVCAIRCQDGILLTAARKVRNSKLIVESSKKVHFVDRHVCVAVSGFVFEATQLIDLAKQECANYREIYNSPIPIENLCDYLSNILHMLTRDGRYRPLGVSLVVAGWDEESGPQLFTTDPEGSFSGWNAVAIGSNSADIRKSLAEIVKTEENNDVCKRTVVSVWPKFNKQILNKHFDESTDKLEDTNKEDSSNKWTENEAIGEDGSNAVGGDWVSEVRAT